MKNQSSAKTPALPCDPGRKLYEFSGLLRNAHAKLLHVSTEFQPRYDEEILSSMDTVLQHGDFMLVYPEQSMWWNYRKPKPLKKGAYTFAAKNHVPVLPCFITMEDSDILGDDGFYVQEYTIHIAEPIYPDPQKTQAENVDEMRQKMLLCGNRFTKSFTEFPWYMILRKQCSMWENRPISHKNRYQTAGGCLRRFFIRGLTEKQCESTILLSNAK